jgi:hypothetical protein
VFEHVDADDRIEALFQQIGPVAFLEMADPQRDARVGVEHLAGARGAIQVRLDADEPLRYLDQLLAHGADAAAHLERVAADMRPNQLKEVGLVPMRLAHRLEVVGGVLLLGLIKPVVDVHA